MCIRDRSTSDNPLVSGKISRTRINCNNAAVKKIKKLKPIPKASVIGKNKYKQMEVATELIIIFKLPPTALTLVGSNSVRTVIINGKVNVPITETNAIVANISQAK